VRTLSLKAILNWVGSVLGLAGVAFVIIRLVKYGSQLTLGALGPWRWLGLLVLALLYGISGMLLALAWRELLLYLGVSAGRRWAIGTYGVSQLAKYLPGNVFHLAGRQAIGVAAGIPAWPLAKSSIWELGTISVTGSLFGLLVLPLLNPSVSEILPTGLFAVALFVVLWIASRQLSSHIARAVSLHAIFLALSGLLFAGVLTLTAHPRTSTGSLLVLLCGAYVTAWLAGLVTPGTPAGMGVREVVLYALLHALVIQKDLLTVILIARMVTVTGDLCFYFVASVFFVNQGRRQDNAALKVASRTEIRARDQESD
jgi:uncharacterized membrane protein YbhN (UPF0104 family)